MNLFQLNLHETDLLFRYLSHHLTWHCFSISEDLHRFAAFACKFVCCYCFCGKIVQKQQQKQFCLHMLQISCKSVKSSEILEQCHVKLWLKYRNNRSVSWRLSCITSPPRIFRISYGTKASFTRTCKRVASWPCLPLAKSVACFTWISIFSPLPASTSKKFSYLIFPPTKKSDKF